MIWVVNNSDKTLEVCIVELKKWFYFRPYKPVRIAKDIALKYIGTYHTLQICNKPELFFKDTPLRQLVCRDAGIGDILLLEPVLRGVKNSGNIQLEVLTAFPEVLENNPFIDRLYKQLHKGHKSGLQMQDFDSWENLENYSETCVTRNKKHRTDIYNEKFNVELKDREPRLYFKKEEKILLNRLDGYRYIGVAFDASHGYRRIKDSWHYIDYILKADEKNIVVVFGNRQFVEIKNQHKRIIDLQEKINVRQMVNYVRGLDYLISVDSGVMHVALALHIPTVCIFSIITPDFRLRYYTGSYVVHTEGVDCIGCGDWHMASCRHETVIRNQKDPSFIPPCLQIMPETIYAKMLGLAKCERREFINDGVEILEEPDKTEVIKPVSVIPHSKTKLTMPIIVQNEEFNLPRFIENVISHPAIGTVIAIDGGSTDKTVELLEKAGAHVYTHAYDKTYHDMQALQRNISCSFVPDGEKIIIMDIDECFSKELSDYLFELAESNIQYGLISRKTFNFYDDITHPERRIKDYPDYQPRYYVWNRKYKFVGSPHHTTYNVPAPIKINKDIIHFEKEGKNRDALEKQWADMWKKSKAIYK